MGSEIERLSGLGVRLMGEINALREKNIMLEAEIAGLRETLADVLDFFGVQSLGEALDEPLATRVRSVLVESED